MNSTELMAFHRSTAPDINYKQLFDALRATVLNEAPRGMRDDPPEAVAERRRRVEAEISAAEALTFDRDMPDDAFWQRLATKPFYAGKRVSTIRSRDAHMTRYLGDWSALVNQAWCKEQDDLDIDTLLASEWRTGTGTSHIRGKMVATFLADPGCQRHEEDLLTTLRAASVLRRKKGYKPGLRFIEFFVAPGDDIALPKTAQSVFGRLNDLQLGPVTTFHFMMELGLPVVKPDRALTKVAVRLGLIDRYPRADGTMVLLDPDISAARAKTLGQNLRFCWALQERFMQISAASGYSMRALDMILVKLAQEPDEKGGYVTTVCADKPLCTRCGGMAFCRYAVGRKQAVRPRPSEV